jgi:PAS domain S-box-containing protein
MNVGFRRVVDALPGLVWTSDPSGHTDFLNQKWLEYAGLTAEEARGDGWQGALHPEDRPALVQFWRSIIATGAAGEAEARLRRADGVYRWFLFRASPLTDADGRVVGWCGMNTEIEDRKQMEAALREQERLSGLIVHGLPAQVTMMSPEGKVQGTNRHTLEYFDTDLDGFIARGEGGGKALYYHSDDREELLRGWRLSLQSGEPFTGEARIERADGVQRWHHVQGLPLRDVSGRIVSWYVLATDIDERRRAQALLAGERRVLEMAASGQALSVILEALCLLVEESASGRRCSIALADPAGARLRHGASPSLPLRISEALFGYPQGNAPNPDVMAAAMAEPLVCADLHVDAPWRVAALAASAREDGLRACWSTPITSTGGAALGVLALLSEESGTPTQLDCDLIDRVAHLAGIIIERTLGEASLKRSEAFLTDAQRLSATGSFSWCVGGGEIFWSSEAYCIYGLDRTAPVTPELVRARTHPEDVSLFDAIVSRDQRDGAAFVHEHRLKMPDGSVKYLRATVRAAHASQDEVEYIGAIQDVTQRHLSEEALGKVRSQLAHVARATTLGALTASIAHEINQPLSGIITNAGTCQRMLSAEPPNIEGARETARRTIRDGNRAADIISRLRALFAGKYTAMEEVDLNEAAREVLTLLPSELRRSGVGLRAELAEAAPPVLGDRVQLQQVILNLLLNGAEAMSGAQDGPRRLVLRTAADDQHVFLEVEDAGVGLSPEASERLFDAFYTTKPEGMGIGLAVSRSIIESHQGRLWAKPNDGPGATFSFAIPIRSAPLANMPGVGEPEPA